MQICPLQMQQLQLQVYLTQINISSFQNIYEFLFYFLEHSREIAVLNLRAHDFSP